MAWEWSHTQEAYADAQRNVEEKDREWLEVVYAEWHAHTSREDDEGAFNQRKYHKALKQAKKLDPDTLAEFIWEKMSEQATCDNGGFNAWCCPYGCGCHTVPFNRENDDENDDDWINQPFEDDDDEDTP